MADERMREVEATATTLMSQEAIAQAIEAQVSPILQTVENLRKAVEGDDAPSDRGPTRIQAQVETVLRELGIETKEPTGTLADLPARERRRKYGESDIEVLNREIRKHEIAQEKADKPVGISDETRQALEDLYGRVQHEITLNKRQGYDWSTPGFAVDTTDNLFAEISQRTKDSPPWMLF